MNFKQFSIAIALVTLSLSSCKPIKMSNLFGNTSRKPTRIQTPNSVNTSINTNRRTNLAPPSSTRLLPPDEPSVNIPLPPDSANHDQTDFPPPSSEDKKNRATATAAGAGGGVVVTGSAVLGSSGDKKKEEKRQVRLSKDFLSTNFGKR